MRRTIGLTEQLRRNIALATTYLGLPSSEAFIQRAIANELDKLTRDDASLRKVLSHEDLRH